MVMNNAQNDIFFFKWYMFTLESHVCLLLEIFIEKEGSHLTNLLIPLKLLETEYTELGCIYLVKRQSGVFQ